MKKWLSVLMVLLALVCALAACDNTETPNTDNGNENTEQNGGDNNQTPHTHAYGVWSVTTAATCGAIGEEKSVCSCGAIKTRKIAATGAHTYGTWSVTTVATCVAKGEEKRLCACGANETRETQATGVHTSGADGFCLNCDAPLAPTDGVIYDFSDDGTYAMVLGYSGEANRVNIADTYLDKLVKEIYSEAFKKATITAVVIPASVTSIGSYAFYQ